MNNGLLSLIRDEAGSKHGIVALETNRLSAMLRKLERSSVLDHDDIDAMQAMPWRDEVVRGGAYLFRESVRAAECCVLVSGYACRSKLTRDGQRQIVSFHIPGDLLDIQHLLLARTDHNVELITDAAVSWVPIEALREVTFRRINIAHALWRDTLIDASIFREWVLNVGQRDGRARVSHLLCEFAYRRAAAGLGRPEEFDLPMTQEQIADATGMTPIHVNRMLAALRTEGVISSVKRRVEIKDWARIQRIAEFDPDYLHIAAAI
jgi:CRP-like cAMP-binding protein